jgi:hypothetical protein
MSWFTLSEVLGECYANRAALLVTNKLTHIENETARMFLPHAYEHIVSDSNNLSLSRRAFARLLRLMKDSSEHVRNEAELSLHRLRGVSEEFTRDPLHAQTIWRQPWIDLQIGAIVEGKVESVDGWGLVVQIWDELEYLDHTNIAGLQVEEYGLRQYSDPQCHAQWEERLLAQLETRVGETMRLKVLGIDRWRLSLQLSELAGSED